MMSLKCDTCKFLMTHPLDGDINTIMTCREIVQMHNLTPCVGIVSHQLLCRQCQLHKTPQECTIKFFMDHSHGSELNLIINSPETSSDSSEEDNELYMLIPIEKPQI